MNIFEGMEVLLHAYLTSLPEGVSGQFYTPPILLPGKEYLVPTGLLDERLSGPQSQAGYCGEEKKSLAPTRD
jgi:hypothetical protein